MSRFLLLTLSFPIWLLFHMDRTTGQEYYLKTPLSQIDCRLLKDQYQLVQPNTRYECINLDGDSAISFPIEEIVKGILNILRKG